MNLSLKNILFIVIGIAASGVATADETSISLSLTNVVKSTKAGKQLKASKQSRASSKTSKTKTKTSKGDHSLSYSMSYGSGSDPDSEKAGLILPIKKLLKALQNFTPNKSFLIGAEAAVFLTGIVEAITVAIYRGAREVADTEGVDRIQTRHIRTALDNDDDLSWLFRNDDWQDTELVVTLTPFFKMLPVQRYSITGGAENDLNQLVNNAFGIFTLEAMGVADSENVSEINVTILLEAVNLTFLRLNNPGGTAPSYSVRDAVNIYANQALDAWRS